MNLLKKREYTQLFCELQQKIAQYNYLLEKRNNMETIDLKKTDLQKAYNNASEETKQTLKNLYPDFQFERVLPKTWREFEDIIGIENVGAPWGFCELEIGSFAARIKAYRLFWKSNYVPNKYVALRKLELLRDYYNDGWVPNWSDHNYKHIIYYSGNDIGMTQTLSGREFLSFKKHQIRDEFYTNFKDLIKEAGDLI
jgi:hypothetical protein